MEIKPYLEDLNTLHVGTMGHRSYYLPKNLDGDIKLTSLNGDWAFKFHKSRYEVDESFIFGKTDGFDTLKVPSSWNMHGYDYQAYLNTEGPIPFTPPYVPDENPCGAYVTTFCIKSLENKQFLNFDGVDSCFYVWINGNFVGYSQVAHATSEFDISDFVKQGENTLSVLVFKWCDGTFLECQDKFRMSGIFRDVYILERPENHIRDFTVKTKLSDDFKTADVTVDLEWFGDKSDVKISLFDNDKIIATTEKFTVQNPRLWNAEQPNLYTLRLETNDEIIDYKIGFKKVEIKDAILYINGQNVKIKGVNRHDSDSITGQAISREQLIADLKLMKEHNVNAIRTSHYPNSPWAYDLYSELGFYVMAEADIESHNARDLYGGGQLYNSELHLVDDYTLGTLCHDERFLEPMLDRVKACVIREKNSPCIFMWSLGNESGYGPNMEKCAEWVKEFDENALIQYESSVYQKVGYKNDLTNIDVYSRMYISPENITNYCENNPLKPIVLCEYSHAMGNSNGDLEHYYQTMKKYDTYFGGFIWEWNDHGIYMGKTIDGKPKYYYGGDFNEPVHSGTFCLDGLLHSDRTPKTNLLEFKNVHRPVRADFSNSKIILTNENDFIDICDEYYAKITQVIDEEEVFSKIFDDLSIKPRQSIEVSHDIVESDELSYLMIEYFTKNETKLIPSDYKVGFDQIILQKPCKKEIEKPKTSFEICETERKIIVSNENFCHTFDKVRCSIDNLIAKNVSYFVKPMDYNIFRAEICNDRKVTAEWKKAGYNRTLIKRVNHNIEANENSCEITFDFILSAQYLQKIMQIKAIYTIFANGEINVNIDAEKDPVFPELPRFGVRMYMSKSYQNIKYLGYGPYESYSDKRNYCYFGNFSDKVSNMFENYTRPQESGSRFGVTNAILSDEINQIEIISDGISLNTSNYTQETLIKATHSYKLCEDDFVTMCIDYKNAGIGSSSCGQGKLHEPHAILENEINYKFLIKLQ